jgi:hypothetical protein
MAEGADWRMAHAVAGGLPVVTAIPEQYKDLGVTVIPIPHLN